MPILTVSRLYGSGGSEVAALVATKLGWSLLDNAVVDAVAARMGLSVAEVRDREERVPSLVERLTSAMAMGSQEWASPIAEAKRPTDEQLIEVTRHIIDEAIARGPLVVVGRGAQEMLAAREDALHVFCYAPRKALIARTMQRERVGVEEATRLVDNTNKERDQWVRLHWERDRRAHENYDLSVNTERLGIEGSAQLIVSAAKIRFGLKT
ncbi:MAG: cytidylate kinase-like family protein [Gemmatimonadota bacterium]|nr:cytidylate kinase-like family protein [Gemmatimonadota bacterium]MDP9361480.1 cytidylate kinase-like family protein [Acidobacteriota bacterium]